MYGWSAKVLIVLMWPGIHIPSFSLHLLLCHPRILESLHVGCNKSCPSDAYHAWVRTDFSTMLTHTGPPTSDLFQFVVNSADIDTENDACPFTHTCIGKPVTCALPNTKVFLSCVRWPREIQNINAGFLLWDHKQPLVWTYCLGTDSLVLKDVSW